MTHNQHTHDKYFNDNIQYETYYPNYNKYEPNYVGQNNFPSYYNMNHPVYGNNLYYGQNMHPMSPHMGPYMGPPMNPPMNPRMNSYGAPPQLPYCQSTYCPECQQSQVQKSSKLYNSPVEKRKRKRKQPPARSDIKHTSPKKRKTDKKEKEKKKTKLELFPNSKDLVSLSKMFNGSDALFGNKKKSDNDDPDSPIKGTIVVTGPSDGSDMGGSVFSNILNMIMGNGEEGQDLKIFDNKQKKEEEEVKEKEEEEDLSQCEYKYAGPISGIDDLIKLGKEYKNTTEKYRYNINMRKLSKMVSALEELQEMIGMEKIKTAIFNKVIFYLQELEDNKDMLHMAVQGSPGVGKTCVISILAKIYKALGFLSKGHIVKIKRDDLIAGYLGQTSMKAKKVLEKAKGGILVIDEAYSLGNEELRDSYSKEALDLLTAFLSEEADDMICIIAGYEEQLDKCFFAYNEGLFRRFTRFSIDPYSEEELRQIFIKIVKDSKWNIIKDDTTDGEDKKDIYTKNLPLKFFKDNKQYFPYFGGDMATLFTMCKNAHARRLLKIEKEEDVKKTKKNLNYADIKAGLKLYLLDPKVAERGSTQNYLKMYS